MPKSQRKRSSLSLKRISEGSASKSLKVTIYRKVSYCKQNHFVRYYLKNNNFKDPKDKESHKHFFKNREKDNANTESKYTSIRKLATESVPTFLGLPLEVSPPPSPSYSCEADGRFDCYDFPMSWDENETIVPFQNGKRKTPVLDSVSDFEDFKGSPLSKKKTGADFVDNTLEPKNAKRKSYEKECKWCLKLFYTKKSENIFCKKCYKLKDDDNADKTESKKVEWEITNKKNKCGKEKHKSSKETKCGSKSSRNDVKSMKKEKFKSDVDAKTSSDNETMKSSETNCDTIVISQEDINVKKTVKSKSKAAKKIVGGKKKSNKDTNGKTVESNFKAAPKIVGKKKKKSLKSTCDSLGSQKDKDNCDIVTSEDLRDSPIQFAKIKRTWGNAVNVEKILSGIYQLTFPLDDIEIDYESVDVHKADEETAAEEPKVPQTDVSNIQFPYNVSRTKIDEQEQNRVSKTVINAKEELEAISLLAYLDMDNDIHHCLRNLHKTEYKKYRQLKRNRGLPGNRDRDALFKKVVRFQQRKLKTLSIANTLLRTHGSYSKLAETIMGQSPSEIIEDSISPNSEYISLPCNLNCDMHTSQEQLKSTISEPLTFPTTEDSISPNNESITLPCNLNSEMQTSKEQMKSQISGPLTFPMTEVNIEKSRCDTHNVSDNLEIKNSMGNLNHRSDESSTIFALPYSTLQPLVEASSVSDNIEASFVPRNVETERIVTSHTFPESRSSSLLPAAQPFAPQFAHEVSESRHTPSTGSGSGLPSRPESARLEHRGPFRSTEDMTNSTENCFSGVDYHTKSPASCRLPQSEFNQEDLLQDVQGLLNYLQDKYGTPSPPESTRLKFEDQSALFGATEDNMTHSTENCIVGEDCQTRSPASCQLSQSESNQEDLQDVRGLLNYSQDISLPQNSVALGIHNHQNFQPATSLLYKMNLQQNHLSTHLPFNQIQSLPGFETFTPREQFFPYVYEQMQNTALTTPHQQLSTPSHSMYPQHFSTLSNHVENHTQDYILPPVQSFATQSHPWQLLQSMGTNMTTFGTLQYNSPYKMESLTTEVAMDNHHFLNTQSCFPPPYHQQTDLEASTSYNVLEPYTSTQYTNPRILNVYSTSTDGGESDRVGLDAPGGKKLKARKAQTQVRKKKVKKTVESIHKKEKKIKNLI